MFNGKTHHKWQFSIAMLVYYQRVMENCIVFNPYPNSHVSCEGPGTPQSFTRKTQNTSTDVFSQATLDWRMASLVVHIIIFHFWCIWKWFRREVSQSCWSLARAVSWHLVSRATQRVCFFFLRLHYRIAMGYQLNSSQFIHVLYKDVPLVN